jgi:hypothetical protein
MTSLCAVAQRQCVSTHLFQSSRGHSETLMRSPCAPAKRVGGTGVSSGGGWQPSLAHGSRHLQALILLEKPETYHQHACDGLGAEETTSSAYLWPSHGGRVIQVPNLSSQSAIKLSDGF